MARAIRTICRSLSVCSDQKRTSERASERTDGGRSRKRKKATTAAANGPGNGGGSEQRDGSQREREAVEAKKVRAQRLRGHLSLFCLCANLHERSYTNVFNLIIDRWWRRRLRRCGGGGRDCSSDSAHKANIIL